jgi:ADP-ribose pyrophosphatase
METWVDSEQLYKGKIVSLRVGHVRMDNGTIAMREVIEHPGGVAVVPLLGDSVILIRQYRVAIGQEILEIPAGKIEGPEDTEHRGRCELEEETGYRAGRMVSLGSIYASVGYTTEEIFLYAALDLEQVGQKLEVDECIDVTPIPIPELKRMLAAHEIKDAKTVVGLDALFRYLDNGSAVAGS